MTVKELQDMLDRSPELNELIILDTTLGQTILIEVDNVTVGSGDNKGKTFLYLKEK